MDARNRSADLLADQRGGPDDRARPPEDLLDNLRLRLSRLAGNHPSAPRDQQPRRGARADAAGPASDPPEGREPGNRTGQDTSAQADAVPASQEDGHSAGVGGAASRAGDQVAGGRGRQAEEARAGEALRTALTAAATGMAVLATMELPSRTGRGEAYRPWFMAGEPASPWWSGAWH